MTSAIAGKFDVVGIGVGPFNLSAAALLNGIPDLSNIFFDTKDAIAWRPGLLFRDARLQTSFLKDLVSFADPRSPYSFMSFLHAQRRLYQFINAEFEHVTRTEFSEYLSWVSRQLPNLRFGRHVEDMHYRDGQFIVRIQPDLEVRCKHVVVGVGRRQSVPKCARKYLGATVFHASTFLNRERHARTVTIVGGGQSAAEVFLHYIRSNDPKLTNITWLTRRSNFSPLDETPFANEYFTPLYSQYFQSLNLTRRQRTLDEQKLASDGISPVTLREIYQEIYHVKFINRRNIDIRMLVEHELVALEKVGTEWCSIATDMFSGEKTRVVSELVVLATGYETARPSVIDGIAHMFETEGGQIHLNSDFSARWRMPCSNRLYMQNAARQSHGIFDPNLSLMAWRSATIINSLLEYEYFPTPQNLQFIDWKTPQPQSQPRFMEKIICPQVQ